jgi:hypothetical protein
MTELEIDMVNDFYLAASTKPSSPSCNGGWRRSRKVPRTVRRHGSKSHVCMRRSRTLAGTSCTSYQPG